MESEEGDFESYQLVRTHYKSCIDEQKLEELGVEPVKKLLQDLGGWPVLEGEEWKDGDDFKWWEWSYKMNREGLGIDSIVGVSLGADDKNASWRVLGLDQAQTGLSREYLVKGFEDEDVQYYYRYMVDTAVLFGADKAVAESELKESLLFEIELATDILKPKEERRNATLLYNPTTLGETTSRPFLKIQTTLRSQIMKKLLSQTLNTLKSCQHFLRKLKRGQLLTTWLGVPPRV